MKIDHIYLPNSLKESTREKRGKGVQRKVSDQTKPPGNWADFLCDPSNKKELFSFLTSNISESIFPPKKPVAAGTTGMGYKFPRA